MKSIGTSPNRQDSYPGWSCVAGEREEWERAPFRTAQIDQVLEEETAIFEERGNETGIAEREAEIRRVLADGAIVENDTIPGCDGSVALVIEWCFEIQSPGAS